MLNKLAPILAPILAPLAPATVLINTIYRGMMSVQVDHTAALITSIGSGIGAEFSGMVAAYAAITAWREKRTGHFFIAMAAFLVYILLVCIGIYMGENPAPLVITVLISIIAYLGSAVVGDLKQATDAQAVDIQRETELTKARASLARANARQAEASALSGVSDGQTENSDLSTGHRTSGLVEEKIIATVAYLRDHPNATVRELGDAGLGYAKSQAARYRMAAMERMK